MSTLLARCQRRDPAAWAEVIEKYQRLVYAVASRNGLGPEDAEDVTQTVFVEFYASLDRIRDDDRLASWLMTVARRQAWRVRNRSRLHVALEVVPEESVDPIAGLVDRHAVRSAVESLNDASRRLMWLLYFDPSEPSYADIADDMGRAIGGIGPMRQRTLERLREHAEGREEAGSR